MAKKDIKYIDLSNDIVRKFIFNIPISDSNSDNYRNNDMIRSVIEVVDIIPQLYEEAEQEYKMKKAIKD